ncbi:MAG: metalloregulator ArsR/SmtB family transcription factor [Oscillospiraceae bacterium]
MESIYENTAKIFKALSDANRLKILKLLLNNQELCMCKILESFEISQPTLSHHLKILCNSGILSFRKEGKWTYYKINQNAVLNIEKIFNCNEGEDVMFKKKDEINSVKGASVKILGEGCDKCSNMFKQTALALEELNMNTDIEHITDLVEIVNYGVLSTPALVVDNKVLSCGNELSKNDIIDLLKKARG